MAYDLLKLSSESEYRSRFCAEYCDVYKPIITFDDIWVRFYEDMFDHAFFESRSRIKGDKSRFSFIRAERMLWIREALQDNTSLLKVGWNKNTKAYDDSRRVAIVQHNYVVIVWMQNNERAKFITAYVADESIDDILNGPNWTGI